MRPDHRGMAAVAAPALKEATSMPDQIIDAVMARSIHADAVRTHPLAARVIVRDQVDYPGDLVARLVTDVLRPYVRFHRVRSALHGHDPKSVDGGRAVVAQRRCRVQS